MYGSAGGTGVSWYQPEPALSLAMIAALGIRNDASVVDVGGGASLLVDELLARRFTDISVVDVSQAALELARQRVGPVARVHWLNEDVLTWRPTRRYRLWHDRALFHFFVDASDQDRYLQTLREAVEPGGAVIIATFAPDGPERCSGLPVARHGDAEIEQLLTGFTVVESQREEHLTPRGIRQPFIWVAARASG